jgi:hypothetical protein
LFGVDPFVNRFGNMGLSWRELPMKIRERLEESFLKNINTMNEVELSCFMKGSVGIGYEWNNREKVKEMLFKRFRELYGGNVSEMASGRGIASIVYNWGELGLRWEDISEQIGDSVFSGIGRCSHSFNSQQISNLIYG